MVEDTLSPTSDVDALRWRAKYANDRPSDYESLVVLLWRAVAGTALAGFAFPTVMTLAGICTGRLSLGEAIALLMASVVLMGVPSGFVAFVASLPVTVVAGIVGRLMGVTERDAWFASLVGGWSGFFCLPLGGPGPGTVDCGYRPGHCHWAGRRWRLRLLPAGGKWSHPRRRGPLRRAKAIWHNDGRSGAGRRRTRAAKTWRLPGGDRDDGGWDPGCDHWAWSRGERLRAATPRRGRCFT